MYYLKFCKKIKIKEIYPLYTQSILTYMLREVNREKVLFKTFFPFLKKATTLIRAPRIDREILSKPNYDKTNLPLPNSFILQFIYAKWFSL